MCIPTIVDNIKEKYVAPLHLNGQHEREEKEGGWGVPVGGGKTDASGWLLCWFWLEHWRRL